MSGVKIKDVQKRKTKIKCVVVKVQSIINLIKLVATMSIEEYKRIIKKIYSDFKKKYPEEYKRQMD